MTPQAQRAFDSAEHDIRIETFIDFSIEAAMSHSSLRLPNSLADDFLDDVTSSTPHPSLASLVDYLLLEGDSEDDVLVGLNEMSDQRPDLLGICLKVATPVRRKDGDNLIWSWGSYTTEWVFAPTYEEAWSLAVEWAKQQASSPKAMPVDHSVSMASMPSL